MNITDIILNNPITGLSSISQNKLLNKVKNTFTTDEQTIFVSNFYMYLNNQNNYCIDIDKILNWLGFLNKRNIKDLLQKYFHPVIVLVICACNKDIYVISYYQNNCFFYDYNLLKNIYCRYFQ